MHRHTYNAVLCGLALSLAFAAMPAHALTESQQDAAIASLQSAVASLQSTVSSQQTTINALTAKLQYVTVAGTDMTISGANLHVVSGAGKTNSAPNGLGNVIIGYNELRTAPGSVNTRTGSHNLILGTQNNYSSYGGIVGGYSNSVSASYASVTGGQGNAASANYAVVTGGRANTASGVTATVAGGYGNTASGSYASVGGGSNNTASGLYAFLPLDTDVNNINSQITSIKATDSSQSSSITNLQTSVNNTTAITNLFSLADGVGTKTELTLTGVNLHIVNGLGATNGEPNAPYDFHTPVVNGLGNLIIGYNETLANDPNYTTPPPDTRTGSHNLIVGAEQNYSFYGGRVAGYDNTISSPYASVAGGGDNVASGVFSSVTGGHGNTAAGNFSSVGGGDSNRANYFYSSISGGFHNAANGFYSSIGGGSSNFAYGDYSSVSGGKNNLASGAYSSVGGGNSGTAAGLYSSISAGRGNTVGDPNNPGTTSSVFQEPGDTASISGGNGLTVTTQYGWAAGSLGSTSISGNFSSP